MLYAAIFLVSLSSLAYEVLLTRVFSIGQWNHLSFMVISLALFGFGASGTLLSLLDGRRPGWEGRLSRPGPLGLLVLGYAVTALGGYWTVNRLPLDYFRLPLEPIQILYLLTAYLLFALPFVFTGTIISVGYAHLHRRTGRVYFATMSGSGLGALLPSLGLPFLGEGELILAAALLPLPLTLLSGKRVRIAALAAVLGGGASLYAGYPEAVRVSPSPYKALSHALRMPETRITESRTGLRGRLDRVESPYIRFAPGLSLRYQEPMPPQRAVFTDADRRFVLYRPGEDGYRFARFTLSYAGYAVRPPPDRVLVIQNGGGLAIACALASGAGEVTVADSDPRMAAIVADHYGIGTIRSDYRAHLARSPERYSVIQVENWGTSLPGSDALNQSHVFTTDALGAYLDHLTADGMAILSRRLLLPPSDVVRMWGTAYEALRSRGISDPAAHLAVIRNWDTYTLILSAAPLGNASSPESPAGRLLAFARERNFDPVHLPGMAADLANRFNVFDAPFHHREIRRLAEAYREGASDRFFEDYPLDTAPQGDERPFPGRILKWGRLGNLYTTMGSRMYPVLLSGEIVVAVVFAEALAVALLLLVAPPVLFGRRGRGVSGVNGLYFLGVGAGFMFVEMGFIKAYTLLLGHPLVSFTVVVSGILIFTAAGGIASERLGPGALRWGLGALIVLALLLLGVDGLIHRLLALPTTARYVAGVVLLAPAGFLMGLPFSLGMRDLPADPLQRAYAWAANGCASVLTAILSAQIALAYGIPILMACAAGAYGVSLLALAWKGRSSSSG